MRKPKKIETEYHKGCRGCKTKCKYNKPVTTKTKNQQAGHLKYGCNSTND